MERQVLRRWAWAIIAVFAWLGVAGQMYVAATSVEAPASFLVVFVKIFSYWTLQTNLLVALACTLPLVAGSSALGRFFMRPAVRMSVAIYIATTGIIYSILLASLWKPQGFQMLLDILLHYVTPVFYPLSWLLLDDHGFLEWRDLPKVLIYPLAYLAYSLVRGAIIGFYPYPFIDVNEFGLPQVLINSVVLAAFFVLAGAALIAVDRALGRMRAPYSRKAAGG